MTKGRFTHTERDRDALDALEAKLDSRLVTIERYAAQGLVTAKIPIRCERRPQAVQLVAASLYYDQSGPITLTPTYNFVWESGSAQVYEPDGLTANVAYRLVFQVIGG